VRTDACPNLPVTPRQGDRSPASRRVHAHCHHAGHSRIDSSADDLRRIAQLLEVEVGVYEDAKASSTTSSSRLKRATG
jgi:predicted MarR family transcription regulator